MLQHPNAPNTVPVIPAPVIPASVIPPPDIPKQDIRPSSIRLSAIRPTLAITLYRRPKYTKMLFDALDQCYGIDEMPITISCDWIESKRIECAEVYRMAEAFLSRHPQDGSNPAVPAHEALFRHNPRLGVDLNKLFVVPKALEDGNFVILLEDDIIPAPDALRYFCAMGERYARDKSVWSVSGYNKSDRARWELAKELPYAVEISRGYCPWGVAIWKDRWEELFADDGARYKAETGREANGLHDHWINELHKRVIVPVVARTQSVGGEDGEHTPSAEWHRQNEYNEFGAWLLSLPDNGTKPWLDYPGYKYPKIEDVSAIASTLSRDNANGSDADQIADDAGLAPIEDGARS